MPGTADPVVDGADEPPSLSLLVMVKTALGPRVSVSVALTAVASVAEREAVFASVPVADDWTAASTVYVT